ncbi:MAG: outer membrane protein assembly factor BamE domain-containing protein [Alphaproteobacteria bacterium]
MLIICFLFQGCSPTIDYRGFDFKIAQQKPIKIAADTKETVMKKWGSPSLISESEPHQRWYYIYKKTSRLSFFEPKTLEQKVIIITFDSKDIVRTVDYRKGEEMVNVLAKITKTKGYESSLMRDIFGNFGRYLEKYDKKKK